MSDTNNSSSGIGFVSLLTIVFITLKLLDKIDWSWFLVLSPIIISFALVLILIIIWFISSISK
jgi:ATP/ADP translocase